MSQFFIPPQQTRRWTGPYPGNFYGVLWKTFNVDLDREEGKIALSRRLIQVGDTTDTNSDTLGTVMAFLRTNSDCTDRWWALSDTGPLFKTAGNTPTDPTDSWQVDTLASSPTIAVDMTLFENDTRADSVNRQQLFVTLDSDIAVLNDTGTPTWTANWWTSVQGHSADSSLDTGVPHPIEYFPFRGIVLVGSKNRIHTIQRASATVNETTTVARLTIPTELQIEHIFTTTNRAWILCSHLYGGNGKIVEWDGFSERYNEIHDAYSKTPLCGVNYKETPIIINNRGVILEFTGRGFSPMVRGGQTIAFPCSEEAGNFILSIAPRGMTVSEDGLIYINARQPNTPSARQGAGVWCLNPLTGRLYQKYSIGQWATGNTDFGQQEVPAVGACYSIPSSVTPRTLLVGGQNYTTQSAVNSSIWVGEALTSSTANRGYFITQYIPAVNVRDFWDTMWVRFRRFITATNRIIIKARGTRPLVTSTYDPLNATITWVNATSFTVTLAAGDDALAVGDEVEVMRGDNAGTLSHITVITGAHAALQTITIDETLTASTATATARFERWEKVGTISSTTKYEDVVSIGVKGSFVQFKIELRGPYRELELESLIVNYKPDVYAEK